MQNWGGRAKDVLNLATILALNLVCVRGGAFGPVIAARSVGVGWGGGGGGVGGWWGGGGG